jgi:hypothetical protein
MRMANNDDIDASFSRPISDSDIQGHERRLMQTMDMIVMKKKRSAS